MAGKLLCALMLVSGLLLRPVAAQQNPTTLADVERSFPALVFADDFNDHADGEYPDGWTVAAILRHPHAVVQDHAFRVLTGTNFHYLPALDLDDFLLKFRVRGETKEPRKLFCEIPIFRADPARQRGYLIFHQFGKYNDSHASWWKVRAGDTSWRCSLHDLAPGDAMSWSPPNTAKGYGLSADAANALAGRDLFDNTVFHEVAVAAIGNRFLLFQDGVLLGDFIDKDKRYARGVIGWTMAGSGMTQPGAMYLDDVQVFARSAIGEGLLSSTKDIEFPWKYNRVHATPMYFDVEVARYGGAYLLKGSVRGGPCDGSQPHAMRNPFVKLQTADGRHSTKLYLFRGTVGRTDITGKIPPPPFGPADLSGPVSNRCYFNHDPCKYRITVGYEEYGISGGTNLQGPCEVVLDPTTKTVLHEGLPMKDSAVLTMTSPPDKQVLQRVPKSNEFQKGFKEFLADNHFFLMGEPVRFKADLLLSRLQPGLTITSEFRVLDVFRERVLKGLKVPLKREGTEQEKVQASFGLQHLGSGWIDLGTFAPGVYHLDIVALDSNGMARDRVVRAFSILPKQQDPKRTPPEVSGLPTLHWGWSFPFQPAYQADSYHYYSVAAEHFGRLDAIALHLALNKRVFLAEADLGKPEHVAKVRELLPTLAGLYCPALPAKFDLLGTPRIYSGDLPRFLREFLASPDYKPQAAHELTANPASPTAAEMAKGPDLVKQYYWKAFTNFAMKRKNAMAIEARAFLNSVSPNLKVYSYGYPYPCNLDYMTPYGGITSAALDLRNNGWLLDYCNLEAYFDECRYPSDRDVACQALLKMERPDILYNRDAEGYISCMEDGNNAAGWPPFGVMKVAPGFFKKAVVAFAFGPMYYRNGAVHWAWDNAYRLGTFRPDCVNELLQGFALRHRLQPARPVKTVAYLYAQDWISKHPEVLDAYMYPYNPADESLVFAYEEANRASVLNGFFVDVTDLDKLTASEVDTMVIPPLRHASPAAREKIRQLHAQGVNLVCFEDATGLEDLFGVAKVQSSGEVASLRMADNPMARDLFYDLAETQVTHAGNLRNLGYRATTAQTLLECLDSSGKVIGPGLVLNRSPKARALLWTLEPTDIARSRNHVGDRMRGECASELLRAAMGRGMRLVVATPVTSTEGHVLAFWGQDGSLHVLVYENAFPFPSRPLHPKVTVTLPGLGKRSLQSEKSVHFGLKTADKVTFDFSLAENEVAVFTFRRQGG